MPTLEITIRALSVLGIAFVAFVIALPWLIQPILRALLRPWYRLVIVGKENVPESGAVVLAPNHVSLIDGFVVGAACPRRGKALVSADYLALPGFEFLARRAGVVPVRFNKPKALRDLIATSRKSLDQGELLVIFPEGQLSRTGFLGAFQRGLELILKDRDSVTVLPVYIDNLWGSRWSHGADLSKPRKRRTRRTITLVIGRPITKPFSLTELRRAILDLGPEAARFREIEVAPPRIDAALPSLVHPELGLLAASAADYEKKGVRQTGHKPGSVGHPLPGISLRAVDPDGRPLGPDAEGALQALAPGLEGWLPLDLRGRIDREGFVFLSGPGEAVLDERAERSRN